MPADVGTARYEVGCCRSSTHPVSDAMTARPFDCDVHGASAWAGDMICMRCSRVYIAETSKPDRAYCSCGARFSPPDDGRIGFSARAICRSCAQDSLRNWDQRKRGAA